MLYRINRGNMISTESSSRRQSNNQNDISTYNMYSLEYQTRGYVVRLPFGFKTVSAFVSIVICIYTFVQPFCLFHVL